MKKILSFCGFFLLLAVQVFAVEKEFCGKIGTSYSHELDNFGLDVSADYYFKLDPYFVAGGELDFYWIPWEKKLGSSETGGVIKDIVSDTNVYSIPLFLNAQVRLPFLVDKIFIEPAFTVGLGYNFLILSYQQPEFQDLESSKSYSKEDVVDFYHGFVWQVYFSAYLKPGKDSNIRFLLDVGYRGSSPARKGEEVDVSGLLLKTGVVFNI